MVEMGNMIYLMLQLPKLTIRKSVKMKILLATKYMIVSKVN